MLQYIYIYIENRLRSQDDNDGPGWLGVAWVTLLLLSLLPPLSLFPAASARIFEPGSGHAGDRCVGGRAD